MPAATRHRDLVLLDVFRYQSLIEYAQDIGGFLAMWPNDDVSGNMARVINAPVALGRNIVINGGFDTDTIWTKGAGWTISGGAAHYSGAGSTNINQTIVGLVPGKSYEVTFTLSNYVSGLVFVRCGTGGIGTNRIANGTYTQTIVCATDNFFYFQADSTFVGDIDNVSVKQVNIPASWDIPSTELLVDGNMEAVGVGAWAGIVGSPTLTKETTSPHGGTQTLRGTATTTGATQWGPSSATILVIGKTYRIRGYARTNTANIVIPRILIGGAQVAWAGVHSGTALWQAFDVVLIATATEFRLGMNSHAIGDWVEYDDMSIVEVSPLVGVNTNDPVLYVDSNTKLGRVKAFDGVNDLVNIYSADLNSVFNPDEGTLVAFVKVGSPSVWTDATTRYIVGFQVDGNNLVYLRRSNVNNSLRFQYSAGGTTKSLEYSASQPLDLFEMAISWSKQKDEVKLYINGILISILTGLGSWVGNFSSTALTIAAGTTSAGNPWAGLIGPVMLFNRPLDVELTKMMEIVGYLAPIDRPSYLLRDEFITADAAPLDSPRTAEPGPGTLTAVQTDGQMSISGGKLAFPAQTTPVYGDQGFYAGGLSRVSGRVLIQNVNFTTRNTIFLVRWSSSAAISNASTELALFMTATTGTIEVFYSATLQSGLVLTLAASTDYVIACVLRNDGAFFFIKGGAYAVWTLIFVLSITNTATLYPALSNYNADGTSDFFRVRDLPAPFNTDEGIAIVNVSVFTQSVGSELLTNGDFSAWTADNPNGWSVSETGDATGKITENPAGQSQFIKTSGAAGMTQTILAASLWYEEIFTVTAVAAGNITHGSNAQSWGAPIATATAAAFIKRNTTSAIFQLNAANNSDITLDNVSVKQITRNAQVDSVADAIHDFAFTVPASPAAGQTIELHYRIVDDLNYWVAYLLRNATNAAWDIRLDSVAAGTATNRINVTGVTADTIRVICEGALHDMYSKSGTTWTKRGSQINISTHSTAIGLNTVYSTGTTPTSLKSYARRRQEYISELDKE